jgi:HPt (histidine-containing phosphotransfer) domain-containing protein
MMDWAAALENTGGDRELLVELAEMFTQDFPRFADDARKAFSLDDAETLAREAHTLKGRMAFFGFETLRDQAASLEELCQRPGLKGVGKALEALVAATAAVLPEFRALAQG